MVGEGADATIHAVDDQRVIRVTRDGRSLRREADIQRAVVDSGFPAPAVLGLSADGTRMLMERVDGPSLLDSLLTGAIDPVAAGELLGGLHIRLHELPATDVLHEVAPGGAFLHLDLHPANVLLAPHGPVVIDWPNAAAGPPGLDVADAYLVMASIDVGEDLAPLQATLVATFLAFSGAPDARDWFAAVIDRRAGDPHFDAAWIERMRTVAAI